MTTILTIAIILGFINGLVVMKQTRRGILPSTPPSSSLLEFIFLNK